MPKRTDLPAGTAQAFNEWMRRFIDEPQRFKSEWDSVTDYIREKLAGQTPSYGDCCARYLAELLRGIETDD